MVFTTICSIRSPTRCLRRIPIGRPLRSTKPLNRLPASRERSVALDRIFGKGWGNYELLAGSNKHISFLFTVKCAVVGDDLGCPYGSLVTHHQQPVGNKVKRAITTGNVAAHQCLSAEFNSQGAIYSESHRQCARIKGCIHRRDNPANISVVKLATVLYHLFHNMFNL